MTFLHGCRKYECHWFHDKRTKIFIVVVIAMLPTFTDNEINYLTIDPAFRGLDENATEI